MKTKIEVQAFQNDKLQVVFVWNAMLVYTMMDIQVWLSKETFPFVEATRFISKGRARRYRVAVLTDPRHVDYIREHLRRTNVEFIISSLN